MDNNEIFCKIFQKDITGDGYIYFPGRDEALEQCTFEFKEDYTKRYESIARLVINNEIVIIMEGYSYYLYFKTSPEKKFKLISVDALLLDMIRIEGSDCFIRANYQTIITFCRNLRELEKEAVFTSLMSFVLNNKKSFKDLGLGSVAQSVLISDCVINNAKYTSDSFLIDPSSTKADFSTFDPAQRVQILEDHLKILKDVADYCDNNGGKKVEEAKIFLKESLAKVGEEISLLIDIIRVNEKHIPFDYNSTLKDNSRFTFKENGMITLGNSLEGETPKIKNSTFGDSFGDM